MNGRRITRPGEIITRGRESGAQAQAARLSVLDQIRNECYRLDRDGVPRGDRAYRLTDEEARQLLRELRHMRALELELIDRLEAAGSPAAAIEETGIALYGMHLLKQRVIVADD